MRFNQLKFINPEAGNTDSPCNSPISTRTYMI